MKLTKENEKILRKLGFTPDNDRMKDMDGWWSLKNGWGSCLIAQNLQKLINSQ